MDWMLIVLVLWGNQSFTVQVPMATEELCEAAIGKAAKDLVFDPTDMAAAVRADLDDTPRSIQTCLRVRESSS
jgi:hypothetical protein